MHDNQNPNDDFINRKHELFIQTISVILKTIFDKKPPSKMSITFLEALLVGVAHNLDIGLNENVSEMKRRYKNLLSHPEFDEMSLREGLSKKNKVISRIEASIKIFGE